MTRTPVVGVAILAAAPATYGWIHGDPDFGMTVTFALLVGASALGFAVDDPADNTLNPCPTTRATRRVVRGSLISALVLMSWAVVAVAVAASDADFVLGPAGSWLAEIAAVAALALAFGSILARNGSDRAGLPAAMGAVAMTLVSTLLHGSFPWLPMVGVPHHTTRWWAVAAIGALATWWWSRDPAAAQLSVFSFQSSARRKQRRDAAG